MAETPGGLMSGPEAANEPTPPQSFWDKPNVFRQRRALLGAIWPGATPTTDCTWITPGRFCVRKTLFACALTQVVDQDHCLRFCAMYQAAYAVYGGDRRMPIPPA